MREHREKAREYNKKWRKEHAEDQRKYNREYTRKWRALHPEAKIRRNESGRKYNQEHREEKRLYAQKYRKKLRLDIINLLGSKCMKCGFNDIRALQIDHINGGGTRDRKAKARGRYFIDIKESIMKKENEYQLLCANCNWIKRESNKETTQPS